MQQLVVEITPCCNVADCNADCNYNNQLLHTFFCFLQPAVTFQFVTLQPGATSTTSYCIQYLVHFQDGMMYAPIVFCPLTVELLALFLSRETSHLQDAHDLSLSIARE